MCLSSRTIVRDLDVRVCVSLIIKIPGYLGMTKKELSKKSLLFIDFINGVLI